MGKVNDHQEDFRMTIDFFLILVRINLCSEG